MVVIETDAMNAPVFLDQLDQEWLLELAEHAEAQSRRAERAKLRYAYQWCVLNPARSPEEAATWGDLGGRERDCDLTIGGAGTPGVAAFAAEPFAAALRVSTQAGMRLMSDALDLVHRLPGIHARVEALEIAPWRARRVAQATTGLSVEAAAFVDEQLAPVIDSCGPRRIDRVVEEARARFDPVDQASEEEAERAGWGVTLTHGPSGRFVGTSWLGITGDTPTDPVPRPDQPHRPPAPGHRSPPQRRPRPGSEPAQDRGRRPGRGHRGGRCRRAARTGHHRPDQTVA